MIEVYCDGACEPNPGPGGWGFVAYQDGAEIHSDFGGDAETTNNRMELEGALRALTWMAVSCAGREAALLSDSRYVVDGCNDWRHKWKAKGWKRGKEEIKNPVLWRSLDEVLTNYPLKLTWCKGHSGIIGNERADELSMMGIGHVMSRDIGWTVPGQPEEIGDYLSEEYRRLMAE
jgi:ribonuclease HI